MQIYKDELVIIIHVEVTVATMRMQMYKDEAVIVIIHMEITVITTLIREMPKEGNTSAIFVILLNT